MHVVWDWNGTLFDDLHVIVAAVNASLAHLGEDPIDEDDYRNHYTRPVRVFYERLLRRSIDPDEWQLIDDTFHAAYRDRLDQATLGIGAESALADIGTAGGTQSLLSMWWHEELLPCVDRFALSARFVRIDGNRAGAGETKEHHLRTHLTELAAMIGPISPNAVTVVGDSLDDALAALSVGVRCVLYDGGSHHREELEAAGAPVADSLMAAASLAVSPLNPGS